MLTIITITYNDIFGLERTIKSFKDQVVDGSKCELIIINGGQKLSEYKAVLSILIELQSRWGRVRVIEEPDEGIYDAYNKGILNAKGSYLMFVNSGDCLIGDEVLSGILTELSGESIDLVSFGIRFGEQVRFADHVPLSWGMSYPTPGLVFNKHCFDDYCFDIRFSVAGDWDLLLRLKTRGVSSKRVDTEVVKMDVTGISSKMDFNHFKEKLFIRMRYPYLLFSFGLVRDILKFIFMK